MPIISVYKDKDFSSYHKNRINSQVIVCSYAIINPTIKEMVSTTIYSFCF